MNNKPVLSAYLQAYQWNRQRTLATLEQMGADQPSLILGWRPGPGRAHPAWQFMHIAVTEDIFATERLKPKQPPTLAALWSRFRGGSTPDEQIPTIDEIRQALEVSRNNLEATLSSYTDERLTEIPAALRERGWSVLTVLQVIGWHEAHHQGQAHLTYNLFKNRG